jgi:hypothetical protein
MPSKSGNREGSGRPVAGLATTLGSAVSRPAVDPAVLFEGQDPQRPLRRGPEVERFNELAGRRDELTEAESDELYRYRIRRLETGAQRLRRTMTAGGEEGMRDALADLDRRLAELHQLEEARSATGLAAGYETDLSPREDAAATLVSLAHERPRGLVAGSDGAPSQPPGSVRVPEVAFAPRAEDVPVYVLAPSSIPSDSLDRGIQTVAGEGAHIHLVHDATDIPRDGPPPLVLNWGSTQALPDDLVALNQPASVRVASDKVASVLRLGDLAPRTVLNPEDIPLLGGDRVVAKRRHGARGTGVAVLSASGPERERAGYDLYQQLVADPREYRVSVLSGRVVSAYVKHRPEGSDPHDPRPSWRYERTSVLPRSVVATAREGAQRVGLDYAGVDVVEEGSSGRAYCLEANAAPGMSEDTVRSLYAHVQRALRGRAARGS